MGDKLRFNDDDHGGFYEPTDSEDNYSEEEKELLQKVRQGNQRKQDPKQEMFAFDESDDEDDDDDDEDGEEDDDDIGKMMADSDIEGAEDDDDDIPDRRAWGSKSRNFYNTDFVDPDYSSYTEKERELALAEEEEAIAIQKRLASEMKEEHFIFDMFAASSLNKDGNTDSDEDDDLPERIKITKSKEVAGTGGTKLMALGGLSKREQLELFDKDSPEFFGLAQDLQMGLNECGTLLTPVINYAKTHKLPNIPALEFAEVMNTLLTTYCSNINFYLMLKANRISIKTHPITNRLLQLKDMHERLSDRYENIIKPQLEALLERIEDGDVFEVLVPEQTAKKATSSKHIKSSNPSKGVIPPGDDLKLQVSSDDANTEDDENAKAELANEEDERRGITYQISKNKGLMPHRKKELRNPRVKHRSKFRKALIRRKGAVRTVRTETKRYGGEVSGIKATVSKSVKFK